MLLRTHIVIGIFAILLFIVNVEEKILFVFVALISTILPDIDSRFSTIGRKKIARILQWFTKHRGMIHSFTFLIIITFILILFFPSLGFAFFLGYGLHLFADSFTIDGIKPFYPSKMKSRGNICTGGKFETILFLSFVFLDVILFLGNIF